MRPKHGLLLFITSCVPGCGEMYQGYMKRGVSILTLFSAIFALAIFLEIGALTVLMLPLWLYSFFDSYNLRSRMMEGTAEQDAFLFGLSDMDSQHLSLLFQKRHSLIGWGLVLLGAWVLYTTVASWLSSFLDRFFMDTWWIHTILVYDVPRLAATIGIIALGLWFIRGPKKPSSEDIPTFTPPVQDKDVQQEEPHEQP